MHAPAGWRPHNRMLPGNTNHHQVLLHLPPQTQRQTLEGDLDAIADAMRTPPHSEEQRVMVGDMLKECGDNRKKLEDMAMLVIDSEQEGGEETFNTITARLDRLERLQDEYQSWATSALLDPMTDPSPAGESR